MPKSTVRQTFQLELYLRKKDYFGISSRATNGKVSTADVSANIESSTGSTSFCLPSLTASNAAVKYVAIFLSLLRQIRH
jgi:hypothetical protein